MKAVFIEALGFTDWISEYLPDESYAELQQQLMDDPEKGQVMKGCGGLRKVRTADPRRGKGKRGGARVIYFYVPEARWFYMLDIYGKNEKEELSAAEQRALAKLAAEFEKEAKDAISRPARRKT